MTTRVIVIGGGLSGLSAAHMAIEQGANVTLIERNPFCGGNSTKATSGINGAPTISQKNLNINDSAEVFLKDVAKGANKGDTSVPANELQKVMVYDSAAAIEWLINAFKLDLSVVGYMGGSTNARCHRGKEKFPGMTITYALMEKFEAIEKESNGARAKLINKARVTELLSENGVITGVKYEKNKQIHDEKGLVIIATGGYGADFTDGSLLQSHRPDLLHYPTTNGDHCRGDGIKMAQKLGGDLVDMDQVQVHPTGLVAPKDPNNKIKFLAAEAMRGVGGIIVNAKGERFVNELGTRDHVTAQLNANQGPFKLILNGKCSKNIEWHCKHYVGRGMMKRVENGADLAKEIGCSPQTLEATLNAYNKGAETKSDPFGKTIFNNLPFVMNDFFHVCQITPVIHYCMGGIRIAPNNRVLDKNGNWIKGLWAVGETVGGVHGKNRLGGNSLLDCVVHGRFAGKDCVQFTNGQLGSNTTSTSTRTGTRVEEVAKQVTVSQGGAFTYDDVAKHASETDCWVVLYDEVYDVTSFLDDHPGGKDSIMLFAGKDATEQFDMLHQRSVIDKHGKDLHKGKLLKPKL